jgi:hypothetical protein
MDEIRGLRKILYAVRPNAGNGKAVGLTQDEF